MQKRNGIRYTVDETLVGKIEENARRCVYCWRGDRVSSTEVELTGVLRRQQPHNGGNIVKLAQCRCRKCGHVYDSKSLGLKYVT